MSRAVTAPINDFARRLSKREREREAERKLYEKRDKLKLALSGIEAKIELIEARPENSEAWRLQGDYY